MSKKQYMIALIDQFVENADFVPGELSSKLNRIREQLASISEDELELISNGAVVGTASEQDSTANNAYYQLREAYSQMEEMAYSGQPNETLHHVIQNLRGLYGISDRYFP
jgi:ABC-type transporter lipoprotein component MlaA